MVIIPKCVKAPPPSKMTCNFEIAIICDLVIIYKHVIAPPDVQLVCFKVLQNNLKEIN